MAPNHKIFTSEQLNQTFKEIFKQTDRASAIVSSAILEEILERLLISFFVVHDHTKKDLFEGTAPISTMSAKINLSYHLGLLGEDEYKDLRLIKDVRNEFAHSFETINFETQRIKDKCLRLKTLMNTNPPKDLLESGNMNIKMFFQINTTMLASILFRNIDRIEHLTEYKFKPEI